MRSTSRRGTAWRASPGSLRMKASSLSAPTACSSGSTQARAAPHRGALPGAELSQPNINSRAAGDAPVLAAIAGVPLATARAAIAARPRSGWPSLAAFWSQPALAGRSIAADALRQPLLRDAHVAFALAAGGVEVEHGVIETAPGRPPRLVARVLGGRA